MHKINMSFLFQFYILGLTSCIWTNPSPERLKFEALQDETHRRALILNIEWTMDNQRRSGFLINRGMRQGCPLAPYLFIVVAQALNQVGKLEFRRGTIHRATPPVNRFMVNIEGHTTIIKLYSIVAWARHVETLFNNPSSLHNARSLMLIIGSNRLSKKPSYKSSPQFSFQSTTLPATPWHVQRPLQYNKSQFLAFLILTLSMWCIYNPLDFNVQDIMEFELLENFKRLNETCNATLSFVP